MTGSVNMPGEQRKWQMEGSFTKHAAAQAPPSPGALGMEEGFLKQRIQVGKEGFGAASCVSAGRKVVGRMRWVRDKDRGGLAPRAIFAREQFLQRLREERSRCDRSGHPFSLVLISMEQAVGAGVEAGFLVQALRSFSRTTRLSDLVGWYSDVELGLLLPDTTEEEARKVLDRLKQFLGSMDRCSLGIVAQKDGAFRILEYPSTLTRNLLPQGSGEDLALGEQDSQGGLEGLGPGGCNAEWGFLSCTSPCGSRLRSGAWVQLDRAARRCLDLVVGSVALVLLAPLMLAIAAGIKLTSPGPVLFRQKRMGQNGKEFTFLKFRTMYHNCDQSLHREYVTRLIENRAETHDMNGKSFFKLAQDPRVTPLGKILRITSLDELPQLFNVLKGEMSLVGPRPPIPYEVERYKSWQLRRLLEAKPGITGLWQVCGRATTTFDEQVRLDLRYVENQSLWLDLLIILKTFKAVFTTKGAC